MSDDRIEHRATKISLVTGLATGMTLLFQLVSVPVCLHFWGNESYGEWLSLLSAFMILRSFDGGFVGYVGNKINYLYHKDPDSLRVHLSSALAGIVLLAALQLLLALGVMLYDSLANSLGVLSHRAGDLSARRGLLVLTISWILSGSYLGIVHRLMIPAGMMYQAAWWAMGFQVIQFIAIIIAALLQLSMLQTSALFAVAQFVTYVASGLYIRKALPGFSPWLHGMKIYVGLLDLRQSTLVMVSNIIQQSTTNGAVLLVAALAGSVAVPVFTTVRALTNLWAAITTVLTAPMLPEVVRMHAKGEVQKLATLHTAFVLLVGSLVNSGVLMSYPLIPLLYTKWTAHATSLSIPLLCLLLASVVVTNSGALMALHLNGLNRLRIVLATSVVRAVLGLGVGALGYRYLGLASFGVGVLAGEIVANIMIGFYFVRNELMAHGWHSKLRDYRPAALSTGSALLFLIGSAFGWWQGRWSWFVALAAVAGAGIWSWNSLGSDLRHRLRRLPWRQARISAL